jgi:hypothetical protein
MAQLGQAWWATLEPFVRRISATTGANSSRMGDFEWLVGKFAEIQRRAGIPLVYDEAYLRDSLQRRLAITRDMLRVEQSLRTVIIAQPEAPASAPAEQQSPGVAVVAAAPES